MRKVNRSALVPYSPGEMFALVDDIESYPDFLPWCSNTTVHERTGKTVDATLELQRGGINKSFTTRNTNCGSESIGLALLGGPFKHLDGGWTFHALGDQGCKVALSLEFEFESFLVDAMFGSFFEDTCNSLVDAFTCRARDIYGAK
jgi:ribosome-associated toxin RatA of RatAB toxin-antitoxin module